MSDSNTPIYDSVGAVNNPEYFGEEEPEDIDPDGFDGNTTPNGGK